MERRLSVEWPWKKKKKNGDRIYLFTGEKKYNICGKGVATMKIIEDLSNRNSGWKGMIRPYAEGSLILNCILCIEPVNKNREAKNARAMGTVQSSVICSVAAIPNSKLITVKTVDGPPAIFVLWLADCVGFGYKQGSSLWPEEDKPCSLFCILVVVLSSSSICTFGILFPGFNLWDGHSLVTIAWGFFMVLVSMCSCLDSLTSLLPLRSSSESSSSNTWWCSRLPSSPTLRSPRSIFSRSCVSFVLKERRFEAINSCERRRGSWFTSWSLSSSSSWLILESCLLCFKIDTGAGGDGVLALGLSGEVGRFSGESSC